LGSIHVVSGFLIVDRFTARGSRHTKIAIAGPGVHMDQLPPLFHIEPTGLRVRSNMPALPAARRRDTHKESRLTASNRA
jgi:hypothetical protein